MLNSNEDRLRDERPKDFWDEYERAGFDAPEEDEDGEREDPDDSHIEELAQSLTDDDLKDPMRYLEDIYGDDAVKRAIEIAGIDVDAAAEDAVDTDGRRTSSRRTTATRTPRRVGSCTGGTTDGSPP